MPHFFIQSSQVDKTTIKINDKNTYRHVIKSLRTKIGEKLLLLDENQIQYETIITDINSDTLTCTIEKKYLSKRDLDFDLYLAQSPLKNDAQTMLIEKATELGIRGIYPILTDNCTISKSIINNKIEKWQRIMYEASKQCERAKIPLCYELTTLEKLFSKNFDKILIMAERSTEISLKDYLKLNSIKEKERILVVVGPEGGFSKKEFEYFYSLKYPLISLGNLILKAETATITALGNIIYEY